VTGWHDEARAKGPGVTVGRSGASFGVVSFSDRDYWPLNTALYVTDFHGNDERFVYYFLKQFNFRSYNSGSAQPSLNRNFIHPIAIRVPPKNEQRAIAHVLGALDDKIELNRRMSETLEAMARALFKSWFVDFGPVRAKAEGRDPGLPKPLADLFPDSLEDSELGEIPKGWGVKPLSHCVEVARGLSYKGSGLSESGMPMHNLNSIYEGGGYKHDGLKFYDGEFKSQHLALAGDLIVANTEQGHHRLLIGCAAIVPSRFGAGSLFSHHIYRVRPRSDSKLTSDFLYHLLNAGVMHDIVSGFANGTTVNMLPLDALQAPLVVVPPARAISRFSDIAVAARMRHEEMIEESRTLAALRDALLPKLISGDLGIQGALPFSSDRTLDGRRATGVGS
jgi:type I restriction enzyme S subunit